MEEEEEGLIAVKLMIASAISKTNMKFLDKVLKSGFFFSLSSFSKKKTKNTDKETFLSTLKFMSKISRKMC